MNNDPQKRRSLASAPHTDKARNQKQQRQFTTIVREIIAIVTVGILLAVIMVNSVLGMSGQFGPTSEVGFTLAGVGDDGR